MSHTGLVANKRSTSLFHIDSGASDRLVPSKGELRTYQEFTTPVEIAAADSTGSIRMATSVNGLEREQDLEEVYYAPGVHLRLYR